MIIREIYYTFIFAIITFSTYYAKCQNTVNNKRDTIFSKDSIRADEDTLDLYEDTVATKKEQKSIKSKSKV